jgi:putative hydroxymethylpyrimidine transport system permease protein
MRRALRATWPPALVLVALVGAWEAYVDAGGGSGDLPSPHAIASSIWNDRSLIWSNFKPTAEAMLLGVLLAALIGVALSISMHLLPWLRRAVYPVTVASQTLPIVLLAPLFVIWLGFGLKPELVVIALICFFPIVVTTMNALAQVDLELIKLSRSFDARRIRIFRHVELPASLPGVLGGAKIAVAVAGIGAVLAEQTNGTTSGLGYLFEISYSQFLLPRAWATIVVLALFTILLFALLSLAERLALPWAYRPRGESTA